MEAAIRWSPHATLDSPQFLIVDVVGNRLRLCEVESLDSKIIKYRPICQRDKLKNYTAFDWSKTEPNFVAIGTAAGEACLIRLDAEKSTPDDGIWSFPIRLQRKCNSIAFSTNNLLATGLDKVRTDWCMNIYDLNALPSSSSKQQEPYKKLSTSEAISSIKFFNSQPDTLICGVTKSCIKLFDLRDSSTTGAAQFRTWQVHNLAIDPKDENYFISAGPPGDPTVSVWDRRMVPKSGPQTPSTDGPQGSVLEIKPAIDNSHGSTIWSLRFSGQKRGCFGVLANTGEIKMFELGQYATKSTLQTPPINQLGGNHWDSKHYTKRSHNLTHPWYDPYNGQDENSRVIGYDFMSVPGVSKNLSVLALHPNRDIEFMKISEQPRILNMSAWDELYLGRDNEKLIGPRYDRPTAAKELEVLQDRAKASEGVRRRSEQALIESNARLDMLSIENFGHKAPPSYETPLHPSSGDQHQDLMCLWFPNYKPNLGDALKLLRTQRRRCNEGYLLNAQINKDIVANDPWLVDMWDIVKRLEDMAKNDEMIAFKLDLSYIGIYAIWNSTFGTHRNRILDSDRLTAARFVDAIESITTTKKYPVFHGHKTRYPAQRQVCLAICGWTFSEDRLRSYCRRLMDNGENYKAIVIAIMRGFRGLAQDLLKTAIQQKKITNIGLGAVIACETVGEEQRETCEWMADETDDPYLKALLNYFIKGDWKIVADMPELALSDRVGVALKYLDDKRLGEFIKIRTHEAMVSGNTEGLVLTGLTDQAMVLFSNYITKFNDLQTAVLAMSFTCPLYVDDDRFILWQDAYDMQLQTWKAFDERNKYSEAHASRAKSRDKRQFGRLDEHPATLRCAHCLQSLALRTLEKWPDGSLVAVPAKRTKENERAMRSPSGKSGQLCPRCIRRTPNCGICGLQLANPDPRVLRKGAAQKLAEDDPIARQPMHCMTCTHSFHGNHGRDWFERHKTCPVPDCRCMCALLH